MMLTRVGVTALLFLSPSIAFAEPGAWIEGAVGLRRTWGSHSYTDRGHTLEGDVSGIGLPLAGRIGYAPAETWAVGIGAGLMPSQLDSDGFVGAHVDLGLFTTLSLEGRLRPMGNGFFLGTSVGYARVSFAGGKDDFGSPDNIYQFETLHGLELAAIAGWVKGLVGPEVKVGYLHLSSEHGRYRPFFVSVSLVIQHWGGDSRRPQTAMVRGAETFCLTSDGVAWPRTRTRPPRATSRGSFLRGVPCS